MGVLRVIVTMLNPILSDISLTFEQVKKIEESLSSISSGDMVVLLVENSGQVIATNGKKTSKYDLATIAALSVASFESTKGLATAMGQQFNHVENKGTSSNLYISRLNDFTILVIDYPPIIPQADVEKAIADFSSHLVDLSKDWQVLEKGQTKGSGPFKDEGLSNQIDEMFDTFG